MVSLRVCTLFLVLVCVTTTVHGAVYHMRQRSPTEYKIENVTDATLSLALQSIHNVAANVKELDLSGNLLYRINASDFSSFKNLERLNLSSNVLYEQVDLRSLTKLQTVDLNNNYLKEVYVTSGIVWLHAANNKITRLTCSGISPSAKSKKIHLANNDITALHDLSRECRSNVEHLDLSLNEIDRIDFGELNDAANSLKSLNLRYNFIFDIRNTNNVTFRQLDTIDLSSNNLAYVGQEFKAILKATSINLSNNKVVLIDNLSFSKSITTFDLRGNGFQCDSLNKLFENQQLRDAAVSTVRTATGKDWEVCGSAAQSSERSAGPYCCEVLSAPFADRLIELKRKETSVSGQTAEKERVECERENRDRQQAMDAIQQQYRTTIDDETRKNQEKIQLKQRKNLLAEQLPNVKDLHDELKHELIGAANELQINVTEGADLLELLRSIVQRYEDIHSEQQSMQSNAIRDWEMQQQKESVLMEENARLKKLNEDATLALQNANSTLQDFIHREQSLAKLVSKPLV
uniref:LRIM1/APL1C-like dimerization domain-containing protein n=1 Tax=Anopheles culicifacies TaxID=139723 RepID=A0A182MM58_9DIPT